jgi:proteasome lid subunit RPN8/RPN11
MARSTKSGAEPTPAASASAATRILALAPSWRRRLDGWSRAALPREACGLLLGRERSDRGEVVRALAARDRARAADRFELDPADQLLAEELAESNGLAVIGVWHSHPRGGAAPSARDRAEALACWWQVIVGLGRDPELAAWRAEGAGSPRWQRAELG